MSDDNQASGPSWSDGPGGAGGYGGDSFTETTQTSWFGRLKQAIVGVLIGLLLIPVSVVLLFWNEGRAVTTARSLTEGAGIVQSVSADRVDPANQGKLVHVAGPLTLGGSVSDAEFGVTAQAVRLIRKVEMYQWKEESRSETRKKLGGGEETVTTYSYVREWSDRLHDSTRFKQPGNHHNPPMRYSSRSVTVAKASLGAFDASPNVLGRLSGGEPLSVDAAAEARARQTVGEPVRVVDGRLYVGRDPDSPQIGDLRISYEAVTASQISVVAQQAGNGFAPYQTAAGDRLLMVEKGVVPAAQMFTAAQDANTVMTWILRAVGALVMFIGFVLFFRPLSVVGDVIPFLGDIIGLGTGAIGLAMTAVLSAITIAVAWLYYRPIVGILVLVVGVGIALGLWFLGRGRRSARQVAVPAGMAPAAPGYGMPPQVPMGQMPPGQWQPPPMPPGQWQQPPGQWQQNPQQGTSPQGPVVR
ncbi:TMEM43 family protein [Vineibacter terrae]|uniref:TMEM43 family protein n=1 Tax=Vineibacter terrae TaxID=2586908 RepID=UPI001C49A84D|nr:TMEM43 family protein [Vineibacter terrae]